MPTVTDHLDLVQAVVGSVHRRHPWADREEQVAAGHLALVQALGRYDPRRGATLATYVGHRVRGAALDELRRQLWWHRSEKVDRRPPLRLDAPVYDRRGEYLGDLGDLLVDTDPGPEDTAEAKVGEPGLRHALARLTRREREVLSLHYIDELPLSAIGRHLGVSESRACQIHTAALRQLRAALGARSRQETA